MIICGGLTMKKKGIVITIIIFVLMLGIFIYSSKRTKNVRTEYFLEDNSEKVCVFYTKGSNVYGIGLTKRSANKYDLINEVFDYLTCNKNYAPIEYKSYLSNSTKLLHYKINNDNLTLVVDSNFLLYEKGKEGLILSCMYESYKLLGYNKVHLEINGYNENTFGNHILDGDYENIVNNKLIDIDGGKAIKIYKYLSNNILTFDIYYKKVDDEISFIVNNVLENSIFKENVLSSIDITDDNVNIFFEGEIKEKDLLISSLSLTLKTYKLTLKSI